MKGYRKYFGKKILWFFITLIVAVMLNFVLPRLMPADPVAAITGNTAPIASLWVFIVGPLVGAALAAVVYPILEQN